MVEEKKEVIPVYDRETMFPGSHECSHFVKMLGENCSRPAYDKSKDGKWWCNNCYILHSGDIKRSSLPLSREMGNA